LLAAQIALGELQTSLGPDNRISAPAEAFGYDENPHWIGVWNSGITYTGPRDQTITETSENGDGVTWLVSGNSGLDFDDSVSPEDFSEDPAAASSDAVWLVSDAVVADVADRVRAPTVDTEHGRFAYWVSDESLKVDAASAYVPEKVDYDASTLSNNEGYESKSHGENYAMNAFQERTIAQDLKVRRLPIEVLFRTNPT